MGNHRRRHRQQRKQSAAVEQLLRLMEENSQVTKYVVDILPGLLNERFNIGAPDSSSSADEAPCERRIVSLDDHVLSTSLANAGRPASHDLSYLSGHTATSIPEVVAQALAQREAALQANAVALQSNAYQAAIQAEEATLKAHEASFHASAFQAVLQAKVATLNANAASFQAYLPSMGDDVKPTMAYDVLMAQMRFSERDTQVQRDMAVPDEYTLLKNLLNDDTGSVQPVKDAAARTKSPAAPGVETQAPINLFRIHGWDEPDAKDLDAQLLSNITHEDVLNVKGLELISLQALKDTMKD